MSKLNPCPFCGGQAIMKIQKHIPNGYDYTPTCQDPSCAGRLTKKWVNEADAIEAWNTAMGSAEKSSTVERTAKVKLQDICWEDIRRYKEGMCASCGRSVYDHAKYCDECGCRLEWDE